MLRRIGEQGLTMGETPFGEIGIDDLRGALIPAPTWPGIEINGAAFKAIMDRRAEMSKPTCITCGRPVPRCKDPGRGYEGFCLKCQKFQKVAEQAKKADRELLLARVDADAAELKRKGIR